MKVITPTIITDGLLTSSTAPETDYAAYAPGTTYALGARILRAGTHRCYESIQASNTGHTPESSPTWWLDIAPTNRWAMFDGVVGTATTLASPLTVVLAPGAANAIALLELVGSSVTVTMTSGGTTVYSLDKSLEGSLVGDYYDYFFTPFEQLSSVVITDLPPYSNGIITVTLTGVTVSLGLCSVGLFSDLGGVQYGATAGITDYSLKTKDEFGRVTVTARDYSKRPSFKLWLAKPDINRVFKKLVGLRSTPCVWIGVDDDDDYSEALTAYGFYKDFQVEVAYPDFSLCSLEIEGLT